MAARAAAFTAVVARNGFGLRLFDGIAFPASQKLSTYLMNLVLKGHGFRACPDLVQGCGCGRDKHRGFIDRVATASPLRG